mmetsp:Transcript_17125/g.40147  ORF Transcript_17125/g.40147 Transcript_17125/m.40147 type:complete len:219 (+) Transcript_17125:1307-1963(+)
MHALSSRGEQKVWPFEWSWNWRRLASRRRNAVRPALTTALAKSFSCDAATPPRPPPCAASKKFLPLPRAPRCCGGLPWRARCAASVASSSEGYLLIVGTLSDACPPPPRSARWGWWPPSTVHWSVSVTAPVWSWPSIRSERSQMGSLGLSLALYTVPSSKVSSGFWLFGLRVLSIFLGSFQSDGPLELVLSFHCVMLRSVPSTFFLPSSSYSGANSCQ